MALAILKRDLRLFLRCLLPALALTAVFSAVGVGAALSVAGGAENLTAPAKVAVTDEENTVLSRLLIRAVAGMDFVSALMELECTSEEEALAGVESGAYAGAVLLPRGFVTDLTTGKNSEGQIILSDGALSQAEVVRSAARFGELLQTAGQYGVFSGERLISRHDLGSDAHREYLSYINARLIDEALEAEPAYFTVKTLGKDGGLSPAGHYAACWLSALLFLCALFFGRLYTADLSRGMLCRLRACGVGDGAFLSGKLLCPLLFRLALLAGAAALLGAVVELRVTVSALLSAVGGAFVLSLAGMCPAVCLKRGEGVTLAVTALGLFLCGGLVPRQMLPRWLMTLGDLTPVGAARSLLVPLFGGTLSPVGAAAAAGYVFLCLFLLFRRLNALRTGGEEG